MRPALKRLAVLLPLAALLLAGCAGGKLEGEGGGGLSWEFYTAAPKPAPAIVTLKNETSRLPVPLCYNRS